MFGQPTSPERSAGTQMRRKQTAGRPLTGANT